MLNFFLFECYSKKRTRENPWKPYFFTSRIIQCTSSALLCEMQLQISAFGNGEKNCTLENCYRVGSFLKMHFIPIWQLCKKKVRKWKKNIWLCVLEKYSRALPQDHSNVSWIILTQWKNKLQFSGGWRKKRSFLDIIFFTAHYFYSS